MLRLFITSTCLLLMCCGGDSGPTNVNLLIITVDTLRVDHLGTYGAERATPGIDLLADRGVVFEQAWSASSWTLPSLATLMTGRHARSHGAVDDRRGVNQEIPTLAQTLRSRGYATSGIGSHIFLGKRFGLQNGFEEYDSELIKHYNQRRESHAQISSERLSDKAIDWIDQADEDRPWFLWVHYFDPHHTYQPHEGLTRGEEPVDLYSGEVAFVDLHLKRLFQHLEDAGLDEDTLVLFVADHGEEFQDHGGWMHRRTLYEEVLQVPLILRGPGLNPARVTQPVSMVDLAPTLYELLNIAPPAGLQGRSLVPAMRGETMTPATLIAELEGPKPVDAVRQGPWKLVIDPIDFSHELYNLDEDPGEQNDLSKDHPQHCATLLKALRTELKQAEVGEGSKVELSESDRANLEALGYGGQ